MSACHRFMATYKLEHNNDYMKPYGVTLIAQQPPQMPRCIRLSRTMSSARRAPLAQAWDAGAETHSASSWRTSGPRRPSSPNRRRRAPVSLHVRYLPSPVAARSRSPSEASAWPCRPDRSPRGPAAAAALTSESRGDAEYFGPAPTELLISCAPGPGPDLFDFPPLLGVNEYDKPLPTVFAASVL
eukprot:CAMPEP_0177152648 /NCGR_PEP_ID=MMETSP0367-20130122/645_1 /TAXON_ID=447022 ORGANISM="Scrippsiella hangoei-like, Strain SHHI-4" /NCGR_SAMPLE_ID=MMETSP0367 /ASSEMBLY_ACC=CAM_ASM_000362 /LENGTH=184 /DNA_ID=CAMNT_0018597729 /DNA_START=221 /DNA_END=775 /DNA_ORIENTATION=-